MIGLDDFLACVDKSGLVSREDLNPLALKTPAKSIKKGP